MNIIKTTNSSSQICLNMDELLILNNSLIEICHGFNVRDFENNIGASKDTAKNMRKFFGSTINMIDKFNNEIQNERSY